MKHGLNTVGIRTARWKVVRYSTGELEVYDLSRDPLELHSLNRTVDLETRSMLLDAWRRYAGCAGAECRQVLPPALLEPRAANVWITRHQEQARAGYFRY